MKIGEDEIKNHVVTNKENTVTLVKQNTSKEGLNGANFSLKDETDQSEKTIHLDGSSLELKGQLTSGHTYSLKEVEAPKGYALIEDDFQFTVDKAGKLAITKGNMAYQLEGTTITVTDPSIDLTFEKLVLDKPQDGAIYKIRGEFADGSKEMTWTSEKAGMQWKALFIGGQSYQLEEVQAPSGYVKAEDVPFTVKEDGKMEVKMVDKPEEKASKKKDDTDTGVQTGTMFYVQTGLISLLAAYFLMESQRRKRK